MLALYQTPLFTGSGPTRQSGMHQATNYRVVFAIPSSQNIGATSICYEIFVGQQAGTSRFPANSLHHNLNVCRVGFMSVAQMRPTFLLRAPLTTAQLMHCIREHITDSSLDYDCQFATHHVIVSLRPAKRHFWSPWMNLEIREIGDGSEVFGRFSPHPSIWTAIMFSYLAIATVCFFAIMFGVSQQLAGQTPWAYLVIPIGLLISVGLWIASKAGQRLAFDEMQQMRSIVQNCVANATGN